MSGAGTFAPQITLDALFQRNAQAGPEATAITEHGSAGLRELSYAALNDDVNAVAAQIEGFKFDTPRNTALLLPKGGELAIALLAVMRAGHCAVPMPVAWRKSDLVRALRTCEAAALITTANFAHEALPALAASAASEVFELSFPCAFGDGLPDGIIPLSLDRTKQEIKAVALAQEQAAIATFGANANGVDLFPRTNAQWLAAGLSPLLAADIRQGDTIVSAVPPASLAGVAGAFIPWLLTGGTLELHADMPREAMFAEGKRVHLLAPARLVPAIAHVLGAPLASSTGVHAGGTADTDFSAIKSERLCDLYALGEHAAFALRRTLPSQSPAVPAGEVPAGAAGGPVTVETSRSSDGEILVRSALLATSAKAGEWAQTGFSSYAVDGGGFLPVAPPGLLSIGGLQFGANDLERRILKAVPDAKVAQTADPLLGTRIVIWSAQPDHAVDALLEAGLPRIIAHSVIMAEQARKAG